jgi:hypothetical protein
MTDAPRFVWRLRSPDGQDLVECWLVDVSEPRFPMYQVELRFAGNRSPWREDERHWSVKRGLEDAERSKELWTWVRERGTADEAFLAIDDFLRRMAGPCTTCASLNGRIPILLRMPILSRIPILSRMYYRAVLTAWRSIAPVPSSTGHNSSARSSSGSSPVRDNSA